jgi:nucleoside-diphosphate-sugar epimerase
MRILVLGGSGFIGPYVVRGLAVQGHEVAVFSRGKRQTELPESVTPVLGDYKKLLDFRGEFRELFGGAGPEIVVDMIPMTEQDARNVVATFAGMARRVVAASSQDVYRAWGYVTGLEAEPVDPHITEDSPLRESRYPYRGRGFPVSIEWDMENYDKILVESVLQSDPALPATIVRLPMVYGAGDYIRRTFPFLKRMDDGRLEIPLEEAVARWRAPWGYVEDVATAMALAVTKEIAAGRIYNVAEQDHRSTAEFIRDIGEAVGWTGRVVELPAGALPGPWSAYRAEQHALVDSSRIRRELGYQEITPRATAMRRTIEWERAHPPDPIPANLFDYAAEDRALEQYRRQQAPAHT